MPGRFVLLRLVLVVLLGSSLSARAYFVGPPVSLDELVQKSDFIFKGTVVSESPANPSGFRALPGFLPIQTRFHVISVIKGQFQGETASFLHYDTDARDSFTELTPQYYHFTPGQPYLVFASRLPADPDGVYRQVWMNHKGISDEGVLLCADDKPVTESAIQAVFWAELTALLRSTQPSSVVYAIQHLAQFSGIDTRSFSSLQEFPRDDVIAALKDLPNHPNPEIAQAALLVIGSNNPYMTEERTPFWLSTVGSADTPGLSNMDPKMKNETAARNVPGIVSLADSQAADSTRALAILSLGLTRDSALKGPLLRWLVDPAPPVRAAAVTLLADFPDLATAGRFSALATDPSSPVRAAVARAIGFGQYVGDISVLAALLKDADPKVRQLAATSLLSFSPKNEAVAKIFEAQRGNQEFAPLFLLALARDHPASYRDALAEVVSQNLTPANWGGGEIPAFTAWKLLFADLKAQSDHDLHSGKLDPYLDAFEQVGNYSSAGPRSIYAFYLQKGFPDRAKKFRARANAKATYDLDYFFKQADTNPSLYLEN